MNKTWLWIIIAAALALRAALFTAAWQDRTRTFTPDSESYWSLSESIAHQANFSHDGETEVFRTPGYPAFLAPAYLVDPNYGWRLALGLQVLLDVLLVYITFLLASELLNKQAAIVAMMLQAISPLAMAASCRILSDSLFALLLTLAILLTLRHLKTDHWWLLASAAAVMAAACYVRPIGLVLSIVFVLVLLFGRRSLRRAALFAGIVGVCIAPWIMRNAIHADYVGFSSFATDSLYRYTAPEILSRVDGISPTEAAKKLESESLKQHEKSKNQSVGSGVRYRRDLAVGIIRQA